MKKVYQTNRDPKSGNCFAACIASILELETIPNISGEKDEWFSSVNKFLEKYNLYYFEFHFSEEDAEWNPTKIPGYYIIIGESINGVKHAVVGKDGKIIHDPYSKEDSILRSLELFGVFVCKNPLDISKGLKY